MVLLFSATIGLFLIQHFAIRELAKSYTFFYPVWSIYLFHFLVTLGVFTILYFLGKHVPQYIGFSFIGLILFKMIVSIAFLLPLIRMKEVSKIPDFISFFIPYFIYLILEIYLTMKILNLSEGEIANTSKNQKNNNS